VHSYFELWTSDGTLERIHDALYVAVREQEGHQASPSAAILEDTALLDGHRHRDTLYQSIPELNAIQGVPALTRTPLRFANPDNLRALSQA